jgi:hypothetical protein
MDLRIIATTNALKEELDPAVIRDGRLCVDIEVGALYFEHATRVLRRLTRNDTAALPEKREYQLAEVYKLARPDTDAKLQVTGKKKGSMGFEAGPAFGEDEKPETLKAPTLSYEEVASKYGAELANDIAGRVKVINHGNDGLEFIDLEGGLTGTGSVEGNYLPGDDISDALDKEVSINPDYHDAKKSS